MKITQRPKIASSWVTAIALIPLLTAACSDDDNTSTEPTDRPPPAEVITETFEGSLEMGGTSCHSFTTVNLGDARITITELAPLSTLTVGLAIGTPDETVAGSQCAFFGQDNSVRLNEQLFSAALGAERAFCVCVLDVGNIFEDITVTYTIEVRHT